MKKCSFSALSQWLHSTGQSTPEPQNEALASQAVPSEERGKFAAETKRYTFLTLRTSLQDMGSALKDLTDTLADPQTIGTFCAKFIAPFVSGANQAAQNISRGIENLTFKQPSLAHARAGHSR